ncbi:MAG: response regulator [Candidatus Lindowbacteria bacterium]|nr:response regulator [Candidatus Lindowbacteria bacterium]
MALKKISNGKVFLIEDDDVLSQALTSFLTNAGYKVFQAATKRIALKVITKVSFDYILVDLNLPDVHGTEIIRWIRKTVCREDVPVIVISGNEDAESIKNALSCGADYYLIKPFSIVELLERMFILNLNKGHRPVLKRPIVNNVA